MLRTSLRIAVKAMGRHKMRTALTMLGMTIGVGAVLTMIALGTGAQSNVSSNVKSAGATLIFVQAGNYTKGGETVGIATGGGAATSLTLDDAQAISKIPGVAHFSPVVHMDGWIANGSAKDFQFLIGTDSNYGDVYDWSMARGRYLRSSEIRSAASVAVLGPALKERLFGDENPVGKTIQIRDQPFKVVGWVKAVADSTLAEEAFIPYTTVQKMQGIGYIQMIVVAAAEAGKTTEIQQQIIPLLRARHHLEEQKTSSGGRQILGNQMPGMGAGLGTPDDFTVKTQVAEAATKGLYTSVAAFILANMPKVDETNTEEMSGTLHRAGKTMTALLAAIATISLVVGGIGIMNIMLISVTERTREIGIRRAVGARKADVLNQFLVEAVLLGICGGSFGILLGFLASYSITVLLDWPADISIGAVSLAFGISAATGIFFGFYPARCASQLDPIDALRYE